MLSPIVLFAYNRKEMVEATLLALQKNELASSSELFIYVDGPKDSQDQKAVTLVTDYLKEYERKLNFGKVVLEIHDEHRGLAESVINGVSKVIKEYGQAIVIEDDLVTSPDFLSYMNQALEYYRLDERIWSISGYSPNLKSLSHYEKDVYLYYRACSWGWGTWQDRWETVDWAVTEFEQLLGDKKRIQAFNRGGDDMFEMLSMQHAGKLDSWAIRWCYAQSMAEQYCIYPTLSRVQNIGCHDGTHFHDKREDRYDTKLATGGEMCHFEHLSPDENVIKDFQKLYSKSFRAKVLRKWKRFIACLWRLN